MKKAFIYALLGTAALAFVVSAAFSQLVAGEPSEEEKTPES